MSLIAYVPVASLLLARAVLSGGASVDMDWVLGALVLGFVTQTLIGWNRLTALERDLRGVRGSLEELIDLHPRQGNPGGLSHDPAQFCPNPACLIHAKESSE